MYFVALILIPHQPSDLVRQSMPFSYLSMTAESNDGNAHDVQVYSDVSGGKFVHL